MILGVFIARKRYHIMKFFGVLTIVLGILFVKYIILNSVIKKYGFFFKE